MLDVLTGAINPSGRLAETFPVKLADHATASLFPARDLTAEYREGLFVGYRYFSTTKTPVAFPFGFGLSYTTFGYSDLTVTPETATVTVTNTGELPGADVVQIYASRVSPGVHRPAIGLVGYARVQLEAGESRTVKIALGDQAFRHWDVVTGSWQVESGTWAIMAGANVGDLSLLAEVTVTGTMEPRVEAGLPAPYQTGFVADVARSDFEQLVGGGVPSASSNGRRRVLTASSPLLDMEHARSGLARLIFRVLNNKAIKSEAAGKPDLNTLFQLNMPFRAIAKMTAGMVDERMVDGLVAVVNGHFFSGMGRVLAGFFANKRANADYLSTLR
jgi:beta-glucosidase